MEKYANEGNPVVNESGLLSVEQINGIVGKINSKAIETVERGAMEIGDIVLDEVFQGSLDEATSRSPFKNVSLLLVCAHKGLMVDRRRLGEYVRAAGLRKELIAKDVDCSNLGFSHFKALLQVEHEEDRVELAERANQEKFSAVKLLAQIDGEGIAKISKRKKAQKAVHSVEQPSRLLEVMSNPQALMADEETKKLLASPQDMRHKVTEAEVARIANNIDHWIENMLESASLLKLAKKTLREITLERLQADEA